MMPPKKTEPPKSSAMEIEQSTCECKVVKKMCRRSLRFDMGKLKRKGGKDLMFDETDGNHVDFCLHIDDKRASQASVLLSEDDPKMTQKVHDAKHFARPRRFLVYHRRKKVKKQVEKKMKTREEKKLIYSSSSSQGIEEPDEGKRKWWEKEAELLHELVKSFISSMRFIQGEIQFSPWEGSVMDSIGGAYLTQNVSDTHSSSVPSCHLQLNIHVGQSKKEHDDHNILKKFHSKYQSIKKAYETSDALDWDSVRISGVYHISKAIQIRGMNKHLAKRIKKCLNILMENFGSINMEWLRDVPPHKAKECLRSIYGLGLKSVECICLLTLQQKAFPIDRNAGRLAVRLGWVPLKPLPEGQEFHLLKEYPPENSVQIYLWPRLSKLDHSILYELHCQMITCAKVFCTKRNPNCNACPMRAECKHFASALASAQRDIEDFGGDDKDMLTENIHKLINVKNIPSQEGEMSKNSMVLPSEKASVPVPKLKNLTGIRTEHQVYILPDSHHVLAELEEREPNDSCLYLLAIWTVNEDECIPEEDAVYGTILIPVRTAVRGMFPLNGTYFQANEVFADDESSEVPIKLPRALSLHLQCTTLYCGNNMSAICKGMSTSEVRNCFKRGFVCFRGFNRKTREPKSLSARFRHKTSKAEKKKNRRRAMELEEEDDS